VTSAAGTLFLDCNALVIGHGLDPMTVHRELLKIDEYQPHDPAGSSLKRVAGMELLSVTEAAPPCRQEWGTPRVWIRGDA
jgi:hypothetical protein